MKNCITIASRILDVFNDTSRPAKAPIKHFCVSVDFELSKIIENHYPENGTFSEKSYCLFHAIDERPTCPFTGETLIFKNFAMGYAATSIGASIQFPLCEHSPVSEEDIDYLRSNVTSSTRFSQYKSLHTDLYCRIMSSTKSFHSQTTLSERIYCLVNNIGMQPTNNFKNYSSGYIPNKYTNEDKDIELAKILKTSIENAAKSRKHLDRAIARNKHLVKLPDDREGIDFITCPVTKLRMLNMRKSHITNILHMTIGDFSKQFPNQPMTCLAHSNVIANGLKEVVNGISRHEVGIKKALITRNIPAEDGLTPNDRIGIGTRAAHMSNIDAQGRNGYKQTADLRNETILKNGLTVQQNSLLKNQVTRAINGTRQCYGASLISRVALQPVLDWLIKNNFKHYFGDNEYVINEDNVVRFYDLTIPDFALIIEFHGSNFHPNLNLNEEEFNKWKQVFTDKPADVVRRYDYDKARLAYRARGFSVWEIFEHKYQDQIRILMEYIKHAYSVQQ